MGIRVSAVILKGDSILLIRRVKPGEEYYTFPGGSVEQGESDEQAMLREIKEELSINATIKHFLFEIENRDRREEYFLIEIFEGQPVLGGPEKERITEENRYHIEWVPLSKIESMSNLYPNEAVKNLMPLVQSREIQ